MRLWGGGGERRGPSISAWRCRVPSTPLPATHPCQPTCRRPLRVQRHRVRAAHAQGQGAHPPWMVCSAWHLTRAALVWGRGCGQAYACKIPCNKRSNKHHHGTCTRVCARVHTHSHTRVEARTCTHTHTHRHKHMHTYAHTHTRTHIRIHMHARSRRPSPCWPRWRSPPSWTPSCSASGRPPT